MYEVEFQITGKLMVREPGYDTEQKALEHAKNFFFDLFETSDQCPDTKDVKTTVLRVERVRDE